jgi:hypothetical protein
MWKPARLFDGHFVLGINSSSLVFFSLKLDLTSEQIIEVKTWNCGLRLRFMVFNGTFNTISVISWRSVVLVEETGLVQKPGCKTETYCYVRKSPSLLIFQCYIYCYIGVSDFVHVKLSISRR